MSPRRSTWLDPQDYLTSLAADGARLSEVAAAVSPGRSVPTCPGWSVLDLVRHCADVYAHKAVVLGTGRRPEWGDWPLAEQRPPEQAVAAHDEALARLVETMSEVLAAHGPEYPCWTWWAGEQTLGFWLRRMAHEAFVHRVDAEAAAGMPLAPVAAGLAVDGVHEVLTWFAGDPEVLADPQARQGSPGLVLVRAGGTSWQVWLGDVEHAVTVSADPPLTAQAELAGSPVAVDLELWGRRSALGSPSDDGRSVDVWDRLPGESGAVRWQGAADVLLRLQGRLALALD